MGRRKILRPAKLTKLETEEKEWGYGRKYLIYKDADKNLIPAESNVGNILEVAGYKANEYFKLLSVSKKSVNVIDPNGAVRTFNIESVVLHRNEKIRNSNLSVADLLTKNTRKLKISNKNVEENRPDTNE